MAIVIFVLLACLVMTIAALLIAPPIILWRGSHQAWRCGRLYLTRLATVLGVPDPATAAQPRLLRHHAEGGREPAYEQYLYTQAWLDLKRTLAQVLSDGRAEVSADWSRTVRDWVSGPWTFNRLWHHLMGLILLAAIGLGTGVAAVFIGIIVAVQAVVMAAAAALGIAAASGLRIVDSGLLLFRGIRMHCPSCSRRVRYPSYRCPACGALHHDIRPGRYGVLRRWCSCGEQSMPTLLILGSHQMQAYCPHPGCEVQLADSSGTAAEFTLPILGAAGAGKTRLMTALVMALEEIPGADVTPADDTTARRLGELRPAVTRNEPIPPTPPGPSRAYSVYVAPPAGARRLIHLFDTAGGSHSFADLDARRYLGVADSFLFVIGPLPARHPPDGTEADAWGGGRSAKDILDLVAQQAQGLGKNLRTSRLGVALTSADAPADEGLPGPQADSAGIERWLNDSGLDHLTRAMRTLFGDVRYFRTAAVVTGARVDGSVLRLARWLLAETGLDLRGTGGDG